MAPDYPKPPFPAQKQPMPGSRDAKQPRPDHGETTISNISPWTSSDLTAPVAACTTIQNIDATTGVEVAVRTHPTTYRLLSWLSGRTRSFQFAAGLKDLTHGTDCYQSHLRGKEGK
jgi:hypothetical protein